MSDSQKPFANYEHRSGLTGVLKTATAFVICARTMLSISSPASDGLHSGRKPSGQSDR
jgi:hypothetical protein